MTKQTAEQTAASNSCVGDKAGPTRNIQLGADELQVHVPAEVIETTSAATIANASRASVTTTPSTGAALVNVNRALFMVEHTPKLVRRHARDEKRKGGERARQGRDRISGFSSSDRDCERTMHRPRDRRNNNREDEGMRAGKLVKNWRLKFNSSEQKRTAEVFFRQLKSCKSGNGVSDDGMLSALLCVFTSEAATWFDLGKNRMRTWRAFEKAFQRRYIGEYDHHDLLTDLHRRTQAKGELIELLRKVSLDSFTI